MNSVRQTILTKSTQGGRAWAQSLLLLLFFYSNGILAGMTDPTLSGEYREILQESQNAQTKPPATPSIEKRSIANDSKPSSSSPSEIQNLVETQPDFKIEDQRSTLLQEKVGEVQAHKALTYEKDGSPLSSTPSIDSKVQVVDLYRTQKDEKSKKRVKIPVKEIPLIHLPSEVQVSAGSFTQGAPLRLKQNYKNPVALERISLLTSKNIKEALSKAVSLQKQMVIDRPQSLRGRPITAARLASAHWSIESEAEIALQEYHELSPVELELLGVELLFNEGDECHMISGLLDEISRSKKHSAEANYHLALCNQKMGLYTESNQRLQSVLGNQDEDWTPLAVKSLIEKVPSHLEMSTANALGKLPPSFVNEEDRGWVDFWIAKGSSRDHKHPLALNHAQKVPLDHPKYPQAQFIKAVSLYSLGKKGEALKVQKDLSEYISQRPVEKSLRSLVSLNLARMEFQQGNHKESVQHYMGVEKDHPLWVEGLTEQGWAQLLAGDAPGAVGNMYSIHGPFFKLVYKPESYVVRTIGYLNLCQYADAYRSLMLLNQKYQRTTNDIKLYRDQHKTKESLYNTVKTYLKGSSNQAVDGLSHEVIREMARNKDFLNIQSSINQDHEEIDQTVYIVGMVEKTLSDLKRRIFTLDTKRKNHINMVKSARKEKRDLDQQIVWSQEIDRLTHRLYGLRLKEELYQKNQKSFSTFSQKSIMRLKNEISGLKVKADRILSSRLTRMHKELSKILENNELLKYEVFAGSGENLRFQATGNQRSPSSVSKKDSKSESKSVTWDFEGEYWEDEIGNYRSSLKNNCSSQGVAR